MKYFYLIYKKIGLTLILVPTVLFIGYCIYLTISNWELVNSNICHPDALVMNKVFFLGFSLYVIALPFIGYQTFKYSHTIRKFDYLSYVICLFIGKIINI